MKVKTFIVCLAAAFAAFSSIAEAKIVIDPETLDCGDAKAGQTTSCQNIEILNDSSHAVTVTEITLGDTDDFTLDYSSCIRSLTAHELCLIYASFHPTVARNFETTMTVHYYDHKGKSYYEGSDILGRGTAPIVSLSADTVEFGDQTVNTSSWQYVTMKNVGSDTLNITSITVPLASGFRVSGDCGDTLAVDAICTIQIFFEPTAVRDYTSTVSITDDAEDSPQFIEVNGTGVAAAQPDVNLSKKAVDFGNKPVGSTSTDTVTVTNGGTAALTITSIVGSGTSYSQANDCGAGLAAGASCTVSITFILAAAGAFSGTVTLNDNATDTPQVITLDGKGVSPNATLVPDVIEFGSQTINKSSSAHEVVLLNSGTSTLTISDIAASGSVYAQTNNCSSTLGAKKSCSIYVTFTPAETGYIGGALTVTDDDPGGGTQTAFLFGTGITGPDVDIVPGLHDFGSVTAGMTSQPQDFEAANTGEGDLTIYSISTTGDFGQTNDCGSTLEEEERCTIKATFSPQAAGNFFGLLSIFDDADGSPQAANMWGDGTSSEVTIVPAFVNFGGQTTGRSSLAHDVHLLNSGNTAITITGIAAGSTVFTQTNDCGSTLAPTAYCTISITFTPIELGGITGEVTITDDASGSPHNIDLTGIGVDPVYPDLDISPGFWDFGSVIVGQTSAAKAFTVKNTGAVNVVISSIDANSEFAQTNDCPAALTEGTACTITGSFSPEAAGRFAGHIRIVDNTPDGYQLVSVVGAAAHSGDISVGLSSTSLDFGDVTVNTTSGPKSVIVTNSGTNDLTIGEVSLNGSDSSFYTQSNNCQERILDAGKSCIIDVKYKPFATLGSQKAVVMIYDDASDSPQAVLLSGTSVSEGGCSLAGGGTGNLFAFTIIMAAPCLIRCYRRRLLAIKAD